GCRRGGRTRSPTTDETSCAHSASTSEVAVSRPAPGGGRWVEVPPARIERWLESFDARHRVVRTCARDRAVEFRGADGATARCELGLGAVPEPGDWAEFRPAPLVGAAGRAYRVGVLLVRLGGYAAGVFDGDRLVSSKVDSRLVHGRQRNGGSSQARYARRRDN